MSIENYKEFKAYQELYRTTPINDKDLLFKIELMLPYYLQIDCNKTTLDHFLYDERIIDYLEESENGGLICPLCDSGLHQNKSGALSFSHDKHFFKCFSCNTLFFPLDESVNSTITSYLYNTMKLSNCQEKNQNFQENISNFDNSLQLKDLEFDDIERKSFIQDVFTNRSYSDSTIDYVLNSELFHIKETENGIKWLYVTMFDSNLQDIIGYQKLHYNHEKCKLDKYQEQGSILGYTMFSSVDNPNCCFIVESITNALAVFQCGFNAICCYTKNKQPYLAYDNLLQKGLNPILFLDRDVVNIDSKYKSINWKKDIESNFSVNELKENADASDLLIFDSAFLYNLLRNAYNDYYKKQQPIYTQLTLEKAFESSAKFNIIQAQIGTGKTTNAIKLFKESSNPLYSVYSKEATKEIGQETNCNVVNSDNSSITEDKKGISTTHARLGKNTELKDYGIYQKDKTFDTAIIDEMHKLLIVDDIVIAQLYYCNTSEEDEQKGDFLPIISNGQIVTKAKENADFTTLAYKKDSNNKAIRPVKMPDEVNYNSVSNYQTLYLNKKYTCKEVANPEFFDCIAQRTTNILTKKIDKDSPYWLPEYTLNAIIDTMINYDYDTIKEELKATYKKEFKYIRDLYLPLAMVFFRYCYLECAFPIRKSDNKILSLQEYLEDVKKGVEMVQPNNEAIYFKLHLRFINMQPLLKALKYSKRLFLIGASDFKFQEQFIEEFKSFYGNDFSYFNIQPNAKKEKETNIIKCKKFNSDSEIGEIMKEACKLDCYKAFVFPTYDRTDDFYKMQSLLGINNYSRVTKDGFKFYTSDVIELDRIDNKTTQDGFRDLLIHGNSTILESSNKLAKYTLLFLDCNQFKPKISYVNPYLEDLGLTVIECLKTWFIQTIGRLYRQQGNRIVLVLFNHQSLEFDYVSLLKEKSEVVNVFEDGHNYSYYGNSASDFISNIDKALKGDEMTKFKTRKHRKLSSEQKQQNKENRKQETADRRKDKAIELLSKGATKRELQRATNDYKYKSSQEWLALNREVLAKHSPKGVCPFSDDILKSVFVTFDIEVYPNEFIICFHSDKGNTFSMTNPCYNWLCHFVKLPLIGFNNSNYDNPMLYYALLLLQPNSTYLRIGDDFNTALKAFSNKIIESKDCKAYKHIKYTSQAIGLGDSQEMIVKNLPGKSHDSIKAFMLDYGQDLLETPYPFDTVLTDEQIKEVITYCMNDSKAVYNLIVNNQATFQAWLKLVEKASLNGNYSKNALFSEFIYNKELSYKERCQDNIMTIDCLFSEFPNFKVLPGLSPKEKYVNEYDDYLYILGDGGFNLLENRVYKKQQNGSLIPIENNHAIYHNVICLDISSMHPHSLIALNYFGKYTSNYIDMLKMKDICSLLSKKGFEYVKQELATYGYFVNTEKDVAILRNLFKLVLNGTYGLTHMSYDSQLKKCSHNLIALRGALFMTTLHNELIHKFQGIEIIQIKTDSIKIANYTQEILDFCFDFAKKFQYTFEIEDTFSSILCNGNDYLALNLNSQLKNSLDDEEEETEEDDDLKKYEALCKGSSFKLLYDDRGFLRSKDNLRSLLFKFKGNYIHKLGNIHYEGKKKFYDYVKDVKSSKVKYYIAVKESCQDGLYPYYVNKNNNICSISGFTSQKVIAIYSLKQLKSLDLSMIDYDFYQARLDKVLDKILDLMLEKKITQERIKELKKRVFEERKAIKISYLDEKEKLFYNILKSKLAFI